MKIDVLNSPLRCPKCHARMVMDIGQDDDGEHEAKHSCFECGYEEIETGRTMPLASVTGSLLASIRDRIRDDDMTKPLEFTWPAS